MRAISGVVVRSAGQALVVRLESGQRLDLDHRHEYKYGDEVEVTYDFTKREIVSMCRFVADRDIHEMDVTPTVHEEVGDLSDDPDLGSEGVLPLSGDEGLSGEIFDLYLGSSPPEVW